MKSKVQWLLVLAGVLLVPQLAHAQATSRVIPFNNVATTIAPSTPGQPLVIQLWDAASGGNQVFNEAQTLDVDANGNISFVLGAQTPGGLDPNKFPSGSSLFLDVVDATNTSVLPSGRRPLNAVPFALSPGPAGPAGPAGPQGNPGAPGVVQAVAAGDTSITVGGTAANPTVAVAANGITNANVADGTLSPAKIAGTVATLGANIFTATQQINGSLGIGTNPLFNLHAQGSGTVETRIQTTTLGGLAAMSLATPTVLGVKTYAVENNGYFNIVDRNANQTRLTIGSSTGGVGIGPTAEPFFQGQLTVVNSGTAGVSGVAAFSNIANGIGVSGNGNGTGVLGISNVAGGIGVVGQASNGALAGSFQGGNVGIGTTTPISKLHAQAGASGIGLGSGNAIVGECNTAGCAGVVGSALNGQAGVLGVANGAGGIGLQAIASNGALAGSFQGGDVAIGTGVSRNGGGFKHMRVGPFTLDAGAFATQFTVTWATAFADTNYTVVATIDESSGPAFLIGAFVGRIFTKSASGVSLAVQRTAAASAETFFINIIAIHD